MEARCVRRSANEQGIDAAVIVSGEHDLAYNVQIANVLATEAHAATPLRR